MTSTGGYVADGIFLYNHIRSVPAKVTIHNTGTVASIAAAVYVAAEVRHCSKHGVFMMHPTEMPAHANMRAEQLNSSLTAALAEDQRTENILRERARIPDAMLKERRFKEVYIASEEAVEFGLAHEVVEFSLPKGERNLSNLASRAARLDPFISLYQYKPIHGIETMSKDARKPAPRGRPVEKQMPEPIPDTPENIALALLTTPPKSEKDWDYLKDRSLSISDAIPETPSEEAKGRGIVRFLAVSTRWSPRARMHARQRSNQSETTMLGT